MEIEIEVPDLPTVLPPSVAQASERVLDRASVSELYFEEGEEIAEGDVLAVLFNDNGTCEIVARRPAFSYRYHTKRVIRSPLSGCLRRYGSMR